MTDRSGSNGIDYGRARGPERRRRSFNYGIARPTIVSESYTYKDYEVGWICALPVEMAAAKAMLDIVHDIPLGRVDDSNAYILGSIGRTNIVIAVLPSGHYGITNAATVASNLRRTFPCITIGLMVGIGGGAPGKVDVRLGDIVVGDRVVQHDFGKISNGGNLERIGVISKPPQRLLTAVAKLRANHESEPSQIPVFLQEMLQENSSMSRYAGTGGLRDNLYQSGYEHIGSSDNCENCDPSMVVDRPARSGTSPKIHYGTIASGNQVIKHAQTRDYIAHELGSLCFEMEAAGLMDNYPCLVIRGICDYCDSHKNKHWQEHAAAVAAAYAKELLLAMVEITLDDSELQRRREHQEKLWNSLWFERINAHRSNLKKNHAKTCEWLLSHKDYLNWLDPEKSLEYNNFLWIRGKPGAGKSTIMNYAYTESAKRESIITLSYFFNARGEELERSAVGMYRSLLFELLEAMPTLLGLFNAPQHEGDLKRVHSAILRQSSQAMWPLKLLQDLLCEAIRRLKNKQIVLFIDALDECEDDEVEEMLEYFEELLTGAINDGRRVRLCFSSRHYPHIDIQCGRQVTLELQGGHKADIHTYVQAKLKVGKCKLAEEIKTTITDKARGIFMWVVLVIQILNAEYKDGRIFAVRKRLDTIPSKLSDVFGQILARDNKNLADFRLCITWVLFSRRPLKLEEFYFGSVSDLRPDELDAWDPEEITPDDMSRYVLSSSRGLAETTQSNPPVVQFIHESVREFFLNAGIHELWPDISPADFESASHDRLAHCCYVYFKLNFPDSEEEEESSLSKRYPLMEYSINNLLYHVDRAALRIPQDNFLQNFPLTVWIQKHNMLESSYSLDRYGPSADLLYILADRNLPRLVEIALDRDAKIDLRGQRYGYPLFAALAHGYRDVVKALLCRGRSSEDCGFLDRLEYAPAAQRRGQTPLTWAAASGHEEVVKLLQATKGVDRSPSRDGRTPLSWAAGNGHVLVVRQLLETKDIDNTNDEHGRSPLWWAVLNGHQSIIRMLLERTGGDINCRDLKGKTPLCLAATIGDGVIAKLLMAIPLIDVDSHDTGGRTPLWWAAMNGHEGVVKTLLETRAVNVNVKDHNSRTPLWWAVVNGHIGTVEALLAVDGIDPDAKDTKGATPLWWAVSNGFDTIAKMLLATERVSHDLTDSYLRKPSFHGGVMKSRFIFDLLQGELSQRKGMNTPSQEANQDGQETSIDIFHLDLLLG